jgi:hypothetical protein
MPPGWRGGRKGRKTEMEQQRTNGNTNGASAPLREKVQFATNVPQTLTLEFDPPAEPREGRWGDQYMYFFAGGKIAWFDPPVHAQIVASGAGAREQIEICKREVKTGNRKTTKWEVVLLNAQEPGEFEGPHTEYDPDYAPEAKPVPAPAPAPAPAAIAAPAPEPNPLAQALILALEAAEIADDTARRLGWKSFALNNDQIVKLAITAYIQEKEASQ